METKISINPFKMEMSELNIDAGKFFVVHSSNNGKVF